MSSKLHSLCFSLIFIFCLLGCTQDNDDNVIYFGLAQSPQNLDPHFANDAASEKINNLIYSPLFFYDERFNMQSEIVSYKMLSPKEYVFTLKENLPYFHHGKKMDLDDIMITVTHIISDGLSPKAIELKKIKKLEKISPQAFKIYLNSSDLNFVHNLNFAILPADLINKNHNFSVNLIGSGPFSFLPSRQNIKIKRVDDGQIVELIEIKDPTVRALKLLKNEIDIIQNDIPKETSKFLEGKESISVLKSVGSNISYIGFNFKDPWLSKIELRKAISLAINREQLTTFFLNENTRLAEQIFPPAHWVSEQIKPLPYDPILAKEIVSKLSPDRVIELTFKTSTDPFRLKIATIIQEQLNEVGIRLKIKTLDWGTYFKDIQSGNFQMYGLTWVGVKNPDIYQKIFHSQSIPPHGLNRGNFSSPQLDKLLEAAIPTNNWSKVINQVHMQIGFIPLWYEGNVAAFNKSISGYTIHADGNWDGLKTIKKNDL